MSAGFRQVMAGSVLLSLIASSIAPPVWGSAALDGQQVVRLTLRVRVPATTPSADTIVIVGDFQDWNYEDPGARLQPRGDGIHEITLDLEPGTLISFRFHRGAAELEEVRPDRSPLSSRHLRAVSSRTVVMKIAAWADDPIEVIERSIVGDVSEFSDQAVLGGRRIWVYLPPGYHDGDCVYPMLLMLDGQNVFDASTSFAGEWKVDETCERLIEDGRMEPLVVVAIDNGQARRMYEYTPWPDPRRAGGGGSEHLSDLIDQLLPWVRARYRVETGPSRVGFAGSSLGGLMGLHVLAARSEVFGRVAALSPTLHWAGARVVDELRDRAPREGERLWIDMGGLENGVVVDRDGDGVDDMVQALNRLAGRLRSAGWTDAQLQVVVDAGARHHEAAWARRFEAVLPFLFPPRP